jgi:hypothetical protein
MTEERLRAEFAGFDSIDERMERVPLDLRSGEKRQEYLENHKKWFLTRHENATEKLEKSVELIYGSNENQPTNQLAFLEKGASYKISAGSNRGKSNDH